MGQAVILVLENRAMVFKGLKLAVEITVLNGRRALDSTLVINISTSGAEI